MECAFSWRSTLTLVLLAVVCVTAAYGPAQDSRQATAAASTDPRSGKTAAFLILMLNSLGEPSLFEAAKDATVRSYRVTLFSPVPVHKVGVRIVLNADGSGQVTSAVLSGTEKEVRRTTNNVSKADIDKLLDLVDKAGFWTAPSIEPEPPKTGRQPYVMDGFWWMFEGVQSGSFHYVFRQNPRPTAITEIGCYLAKNLIKADSYAVPMAPCAQSKSGHVGSSESAAAVNIPGRRAENKLALD